MTKNCLICGVGGQGVVLASKLIAFAAMKKGLCVKTAETIGMAQRGGSVMSHVRAGGERIRSPLIPHGAADIILALEPAEAVRALPYLAEGGIVVVSGRAVMPVSSALSGGGYDSAEMTAYLRAVVKRLYIADGEAARRAAVPVKALNTAMLGAAAKSGALGISLSEMEEAVRENVPRRHLDANLAALRFGAGIV